jgi:hypothetical protein
MGRYQLDLTDNERAELLVALGAWHGKLLESGTKFADQDIRLLTKLLTISPLNETAHPTPTSRDRSAAPADGSPTLPFSPSAGSSPAPSRPPESRAGGNKPLDPAGSRPADPDVRELAITPYAITQQGSGNRTRLVIEWRDGAQTKKASCWIDQKPIWPRVLERVKRPAVFWAKESRGYITILGVKA